MTIDFEQFYRNELCNKGIIHIRKQDVLIVFNALQRVVDDRADEMQEEINALEKELEDYENETD